MSRFEVVYIDEDGRPPFPLWNVWDSQTGEWIQDGCYATSNAAHRRAEREEEIA